MERVEVTVEEAIVYNEDEIPVDGLIATCSRCDHKVEVFGQGIKSIRRACVMLREECPQAEDNYYTAG